MNSDQATVATESVVLGWTFNSMMINIFLLLWQYIEYKQGFRLRVTVP